MSYKNTMRLAIVNPEETVKILVKLDGGKIESDVQDGNQFYIIVNRQGILAVPSKEREQKFIDGLIDTFGLDNVLSLRIRFIEVDDNPEDLIDYIQDADKSTEQYEVKEEGDLVKSIEAHPRVVDFEGTDNTFEMVKVSKDILNLEKKDG